MGWKDKRICLQVKDDRFAISAIKSLQSFHLIFKRYDVFVKLGTITEDVESADCYSYAKDEDGPVKIPNLAELLKKRGIMVARM